jgi:hypothetical protein
MKRLSKSLRVAANIVLPPPHRTLASPSLASPSRTGQIGSFVGDRSVLDWGPRRFVRMLSREKSDDEHDDEEEHQYEHEHGWGALAPQKLNERGRKESATVLTLCDPPAAPANRRHALRQNQTRARRPHAGSRSHRRRIAVRPP